MATIVEPVGDYRLSRVLSGTFAIIGANWLPLFAFALTISLICCIGCGFSAVQLTRMYDPSRTDTIFAIVASPYLWVSVIVALLANTFTLAGLTSGLAAWESKGSAKIADCIAGGVRFGLPMAALVLIWSLVTSIGFMLLLVPGMFIVTIWSVCVPVLVAERAGVFGALTRSNALATGFRWPVFGTLALFWVIYTATNSALQSFLSLGLVALKDQIVLGFVIVWQVTSTVLTVLLSAFLFSLYQELRNAKEGGGEATLAEIFA